MLLAGASAAGAQMKLSVCHRPPDDPSNYKTLAVGATAAAKHLAHGDLPGACVDHCAALCSAPDTCTAVIGTPDPARDRCICSTASRCDDGEACTLDSCSEDTCVNEPVPACVVGSQQFDIRRDPARLQESALGNLVADSLRWRHSSADAALVQSGALRQDFLCLPPVHGEAPCEITFDEAFAVLPFGNLAALITVTGAELTTALVNGLSPVCNAAVSATRFPQVSGLVVEFTCSGLTPVITGLWRAPDGPGGTLTAIGPEDSLRLATIDFLAEGGDGYSVFTPIPRETGESLLLSLTAYIRATSPVGQTVEGRIVQE
jgi:hypothetical protein